MVEDNVHMALPLSEEQVISVETEECLTGYLELIFRDFEITIEE